MQKTANGCLYLRALNGCRLPAQISKVMRLLPIFLLTALVSAHASGSAQSVTISGRDMTLKQVFSVIEKQTGYVLFSNKELLADAGKVSLSIAGMPLEQALGLILKDQRLNYVIQGKTIILSRKALPPPQPELWILQAAPPITGRVTDTDGMPMPGVNIQIKGSGKGVVSDAGGNFSINVNEGDVLLFSFVGYAPREISITAAILKGQSPLTVKLSPATTKLDEVAVVVNTGYQSISRERMTGSYSSVQTKRLEGKLQPSLLTALEGQAAGVAITKGGKVEVRGRSTFLGNGEPLIVVDGFPVTGGLESVNIDNIETFTVLKDAVAASIYGARSSNGVIVITTKSAKKGKLQLSYKGSTGLTQRPRLSYLNKTSAADYVDAEIANYNSDAASVRDDYNYYTSYGRVTQLLVMNEDGLITEAELNTELDKLRQNNTMDQLERHLFRSRFTQQHNLSISSSTDKSATNAAIRYITNQNNMQHSSDNRLILDLKNDWKPLNGVTVKLFSNINFNTSKSPMNTADDLTDFTTWSIMRPYYNLVDQSGNPQNIPAVRPEILDLYADYGNRYGGLKNMNFNPLNDQALATTRNQQYLTRLGASVSVNIIDGLSAEVGGVWTRGSGLLRSIRDVNSFYVRSQYNASSSRATPGKHYLPDGGIIYETRSQSESYTLRAQANYGKTFNKRHRISVIAGGEINKDVLDNNISPARPGYNDQAGSAQPFNYIDYNSYAYSADWLFGDDYATLPNGSYQFRDNRFVSVYSNGSYEYDNRFILSGSVRMDQANTFGTDPRYRYKPNWSVGGTYKLGQESFFHIPWIDKLNIRGSYGINGNISLTEGPYLLVAPGTYSPISGGIPYTISSLPNNSLRWERTLITNVGTDMSLFGNRLNLTLDFYNKLSKDLFSPDFIDPTYGRFSVTRNAGAARNTGIELSLESDVIRNKDFGWNVYFIGSYNKSKVQEFNFDYPSTGFLTYSAVASNSILGNNAGAVLKQGYPLDAIFAYRFAGLDDTGTPQYYTEGKEKVYGNEVTVRDMVYAGTARPKFVLSLTNSFTYQRFDLSFMFISQLGGVFRRDAFNGNNIDHKDVGQRWRKPGDELTTIYPKLSAFSSDAWYYPYSDMLVEKADFMKLRDVTVSYRLDNKIWGNTGLNSARIYFQGRNLWTVKANKVGIDPEAIEQGLNATVVRRLPLMPEFYIGFSVNL